MNLVKRVKCRIVRSVGPNSRSDCADPAEPSAADPTCHEPAERDIAKILSLIYNIQSKIYNRNAPPHPFTYSPTHLPHGLVLDFLA